MADVNINAANISSVRLAEQGSDPSTPASGFASLYAKADGLYLIDDGGRVEGPLIVPNYGIVSGRLTLTSGTAVTTADVTAATTLYFTPFKGAQIPLFDGTSWQSYTFSEISIAVPATTTTMYDVFVYDNAGTLTLELTAWTNDTTRATALTTQNGIYVKTGATTRRYLGSFRTTGVSGQTEDSEAKRFLWNYYNRNDRTLAVTDATASWTYATATWRSANNDSGNRVEFVHGVSEEPVLAVVIGEMSAGAASVQGKHGIGLDSTSADSSTLAMRGQVSASGYNIGLHAMYQGSPAAGYHYLQWLERADNGTVTFYGSGGSMSHGMNALVKG